MCEKSTRAFNPRLSQICWKILQSMPLRGKKILCWAVSFPLPQCVLNQNDKLLLDFLWFFLRMNREKKCKVNKTLMSLGRVFFLFFRSVWSLWLGDISLKIQTLDLHLFEMKLQIQPLLMRTVMLIVLILATSSMGMTSLST